MYGDMGATGAQHKGAGGPDPAAQTIPDVDTVSIYL